MLALARSSRSRVRAVPAAWCPTPWPPARPNPPVPPRPPHPSRPPPEAYRSRCGRTRCASIARSAVIASDASASAGYGTAAPERNDRQVGNVLHLTTASSAVQLPLKDVAQPRLLSHPEIVGAGKSVAGQHRPAGHSAPLLRQHGRAIHRGHVLPSDGRALVMTSTLASPPAPSSSELRSVRYDSAAFEYGCCCAITFHCGSLSITCGHAYLVLCASVHRGIVASDGTAHSASASSPDRMVVSIASSATALSVPEEKSRHRVPSPAPPGPAAPPVSTAPARCPPLRCWLTPVPPKFPPPSAFAARVSYRSRVVSTSCFRIAYCAAP